MPHKWESKTRKVGEQIFGVGDLSHSVFIVESGVVSLRQRKGDRNMELLRFHEGEVFGEEGLFGDTKCSHQAISLRESEISEISLRVIREELQSQVQIKRIAKGLYDRTRAILAEIKGLHSGGRDAQPCPPELICKTFGTLFHSARLLGERSGDQVRVEWAELRSHQLEVFEENPDRLEDAIQLLLNLKLVQISGESLVFSDLNRLEGFFDFYGSYYFRGSSEDFLRTHPKLTRIVEELLRLAEPYPVDRMGQVSLPYKETIQELKKPFGSGFEADQLFRIESKGLFLKRTVDGERVSLSFYKADFQQMLFNWMILKEVEEWNQQGVVEIKSADSIAKLGNVAVIERREWSKRLASWKPKTSQGKLEIRRGNPTSAERWCKVCMSILEGSSTACATCGSENGNGAPGKSEP